MREESIHMFSQMPEKELYSIIVNPFAPQKSI